MQCMAVLIPKSRQQALVLDTLDFQKMHITGMCGLICVVELIPLILLTVKNNEEHIQSSPWRSSTRTKKNVWKLFTSDIQLAGVNLPSDVVSFYAKISIFFMIRHLNKKITQAKQASSDSRSYARKKMKTDIKVTPYKDGLIKLYEDYYYYYHYYCYYYYYYYYFHLPDINLLIYDCICIVLDLKS